MNDDMDLFRKAAENYPLNTNSHDWEQVRKKMETERAQKPKKPGNHRNRNFLLALFFLLIPLELLFNDLIFPVSGSIIPSTAIQPTQKDKKIPATYTAYHPKKMNNTDAQPTHSINPGNTTTAKISQKKKKDISFSEPQYDDREGKESGTKGVNYSTLAKTYIRITNPGVVNENEAFNEQKSMHGEPNIEPVAKEKINKEEVTSSTKTPDKDKKKKQKHFYAGIIAGPDVTSVKLQSIKDAGLGYGLVAGYRLNKSWSIETGFIIDRKYYYTDGEHFNTKNLSLPNYVNINNAEGNCDMFEIPVNVRYNFKRSGKGWFASAGISSYLMKEEYYDYEISRYGITYNRDFTYTESRNTFLAVCNISGGYSWKLGNIGNLRIEPYIKLPLKEVGIGDLRLQSAGIYIGFTRFLF